jgi:hypothetical protein
MHRSDPQWQQHLDIITAWGEASAANQTPPATDQQLWDAARIRQDLNLPKPTDPDLLAQLRAAFIAGRYPEFIDLQAVADAVAARGVPARVLNRGGGTAVLHAGEETVDVYGDMRFPVVAGSGWFAAPDDRTPLADNDDFEISPHEQNWTITAPPQATIAQLADLIVAATTAAAAQQTRFDHAVADARAAAWNALIGAYPDVDATGLPDGFDHSLIKELGWLLTHWLSQRSVVYHNAPTILTTAINGDIEPPSAGR